MTQTYRFAKKKTVRLLHQTGHQIGRVARLFSESFSAHAAWSARAWGAFYDSSILENDH